MSLRLCLFTEELHPPFDEGYKNFTYHLFKEVAAECETLRLGYGDPAVIDVSVRTNKLLLNRRLLSAIRGFRPDAVVYVPVSSITRASFVRAGLLKRYARNVPIAVIGLQPRSLQRGSPSLKPDIVYVLSEAGRIAIESAGLRAGFIRAGVDADKFRPAGASEKDALRRKYGIDASSSVVLHVGHIKESRNLRILGDIASIPGIQVVVVGSSSTDSESGLVSYLSAKGVKIIGGYIEHIEELYQLADIYVFPVLDATGAIELPLSVLEAMACNLPVVTTRFGGLTDYFEEGGGLCFAGPADLVEKVKVAMNLSGFRTRDMIESFTWQGVARGFVSELGQMVQQNTLVGDRDA